VKLIGFVLYSLWKKAKFENMQCWCNFDDHWSKDDELQCSVFHWMVRIQTHL